MIKSPELGCIFGCTFGYIFERKIKVDRITTLDYRITQPLDTALTALDPRF